MHGWSVMKCALDLLLLTMLSPFLALLVLWAGFLVARDYLRGDDA